MPRGDARFERRFGSVKRLVPRRAQVEPIENIVADRLVARVGPLRRRQPHLPIAGCENIRHSILDRGPFRFEHLQDGRLRHILASCHNARCKNQRCNKRTSALRNRRAQRVLKLPTCSHFRHATSHLNRRKQSERRKESEPTLGFQYSTAFACKAPFASCKLLCFLRFLLFNPTTARAASTPPAAAMSDPS